MEKNSNSKPVQFFEHDAEARNDRRIMEVDIAVGKPWGYAMYFQTLELMLENEEIGIPVGGVDKAAKLLGYSRTKYRKFMDEAISCGLYRQTEYGMITSTRLQEWVARAERRKQSAVESAKASTEKRIEKDKKERSKKRGENRDLYESIRDVWNEHAVKYGGDKQCTVINATIENGIDRFVAKFDRDKLVESIVLYYKVVYGSEYWWTHEWTLSQFLCSKNIVRFSSEAAILKYKKGNNKSGTGYAFEKKSIAVPPKYPAPENQIAVPDKHDGADVNQANHGGLDDIPK